MNFDAKAIGAVTPGTAFTMGHVTSGSNRVLFVGVCEAGGTTATGMALTYNGSAFNVVTGSPKQTPMGQAWLYYLINPTIGTNTISVSWTGSTFVRAISASYNNALQSGQPNAHNEGTANGTIITTTGTSTLNNCWHMSFVSDSGGSALSAGAGVVSVRDPGTALSNICALGDSNGPITTGPYSMSWTCGTQNLIALQAAIASDTILSSMLPDLI